MNNANYLRTFRISNTFQHVIPVFSKCKKYDVCHVPSHNQVSRNTMNQLPRQRRSSNTSTLSIWILYLCFCVTVRGNDNRNNRIGVPPVIIHGREYHFEDSHMIRNNPKYHNVNDDRDEEDDGNDPRQEERDLGKGYDSKFMKEQLSADGNSRYHERIDNTKNSNSNSSEVTTERHSLLEIPCMVLNRQSSNHNEGCGINSFVDTGAQVTVMSLEAAERCGLRDDIDEQFSGRATGVGGSTRIVGRLYNVALLLGTDGKVTSRPVKVVCRNVIVIEETFSMPGLDLLLGLDLLTELNASVCLRDRTLSVQQIDHGVFSQRKIPFVSDKRKSNNVRDETGASWRLTKNERQILEGDEFDDEGGISQKDEILHSRQNILKDLYNDDFDDDDEDNYENEKFDFSGL